MQDGWKAVALAAACAAATGAQAQSSVTLSGVVDSAVRQVRNEGVGSAKAVVSGSNATSRIILSGREDIGDDLYAGFFLEHGFLVDTGEQATAGKFWDRRATVSLGGKAWGEVRAGRDLVPTYTNWTRYDPFTYVGAARSANLISATPTGPIRSAFGTNPNTTVRADNAVQWLMPGSWGGLEGGVMLAPGEGGDATAGRAKLIAARLGYDAKSWSVSGATGTSQNSLTTVGKFKDRAIGATLAAGPVRLSAAWRSMRYDQARQVLTLLGATASFGAHDLKASWIRADFSGRVGATAIDANDARQIGLGYVYNLSKRTALYTTLAQISNDGASRLVITDGPAGMAGGGTSRGYELGLRHRF